MVENTKRTLDKTQANYIGLSTDSKPTTRVYSGDTFLELDTKKLFTYSENNINPATLNGWWWVA